MLISSRLFVPSGTMFLLAAGGAIAQCHTYDAIARIQQELLAERPLTGASCVRLTQSGVPVHLSSLGSSPGGNGVFDAQTVVPIASATKTLSAAVLLSLVDDGLLALDDRVRDYLPEWDVGLKRFITLRQCFAHTSGMVTGDAAISDPNLTLRQAAQQLASVPLDAVPGSQFAYGGVSMHVAGAVCEVAAGLPWNVLFAQRIAQPLSLASTDYLTTLS
ncbi:MAG: serine hydrolase domain-containing protein, partial [Planctomycetota bacterium]